MINKRSVISFSSLILGVVCLLLFLGYQLWQAQQKNSELTLRLLQVQEKGEESSKSQEIYLSKTVKYTLIKNAGMIQPCYLNLLKSSVEMTDSGNILMDWQIDSDGKVFGAGVVRDSFGNPEFQQCLTGVISKIVFPKPPTGEQYVEHHFLFKKEEEH
jgi:hypothetical protein